MLLLFNLYFLKGMKIFIIWAMAAAEGHGCVLLQPGSVLMFMAHATTKGRADVHSLGSCLKPC